MLASAKRNASTPLALSASDHSTRPSGRFENEEEPRKVVRSGLGACVSELSARSLQGFRAGLCGVCVRRERGPLPGGLEGIDALGGSLADRKKSCFLSLSARFAASSLAFAKADLSGAIAWASSASRAENLPALYATPRKAAVISAASSLSWFMFCLQSSH